MPQTLPYIPSSITVHLGLPESDAPNVTVPFREYIYNVASSEIYPTWNESALRANILAIITYALNRVYTEYYPSRGYDFNITSTTALDQKFIYGRNYFENIVRITDDVFDNYIRRSGTLEPLAAKFCNGTTVTCSGLSQWGSQQLAEEGLNSIEILKYYYGDDIELVVDAPIRDFAYSYPGTPLRLGATGSDVVQVQASINQVARNYPAIPRVTVDGIFGEQTERAIRKFQEVFNLAADGIVGKATWYQLVQLYVAIGKLNELSSEGVRYLSQPISYDKILREGDRGNGVAAVQYLLAVIGEFIPEVPQVEVDGIFGAKTRNAVAAFQRYSGLPASGVVGEDTWSALYERYAGIDTTVLNPADYLPPLTAYPAEPLQRGMRD